MREVLKGKVALVTGGSRGIGAAIVRKLASEGACVAFTFVNSPEKAEEIVSDLKANGSTGHAIRSDSGSRSDIEATVAQVISLFGRLDILVNNAGIIVLGGMEEGEKLTDEFDRQIDINMRAVATFIRASSKHMSGGGRIVTIGSVAGTKVGTATMTDYSATKAAAAAYTRGFAWDLGQKGITVNIVQPGPIATDMNPDQGDLADFLRNQNALKRYGTAQEVAALVNFLVSPDAGFITGATFNIDGGALA